MKTRLSFVFAVVLCGCSLDVGDLNNPSTEELTGEPTVASVKAAAVGLIVGHRLDRGTYNGYVAMLGLLGREVYNFDVASDPRFVAEMLKGAGLDSGSPRFGGNFWVQPYRNIRNANTLLGATDKVQLPEADRQALRGFAHTMMALDFEVLVDTRDTNGAAIDVAGDTPGPIRCKGAVLTHIADLLDDADAELAGAGDAFPFDLPPGFAGFDTPATFRAFNRGVAARIAIARGEHNAALSALGASFLSADPADPALDRGVWLDFGAGAGDTPNTLSNPNLYAHPSLVEQAEEGDARVARKIREVAGDESDPEGSAEDTDRAGNAAQLTSRYKFTMYPSPSAPLPLLRNEELILLRAEANVGLGRIDEAAADLNFIREHSGALPPREDLTAENIVDELLRQRRYSLVFEGGHSWIDARRFDRFDTLPLANDSHVVHPRYPLPVAEVDAREGNITCVE